MNENIVEAFKANSSYAEEVFLKYKENPELVGSDWRNYFEGFQKGFELAVKLSDNVSPLEDVLSKIPRGVDSNQSETSSLDREFEIKAHSLMQAYIDLGHLKAKINPLEDKESPQASVEELSLEFHGLKENDLQKPTVACVSLGLAPQALSTLIQTLEKTFCNKLGIETQHIENQEEKKWLLNSLMTPHEELSKELKLDIYKDLVNADALEKTIATKYLGKKRFSIEGSDSQILALESFMDAYSTLGSEEFNIAAAHRGRLNLLVHTIGKPLENLFSEWEGLPSKELFGDGDVKYHFGYECERKTRSGRTIRVSMPNNPSHLEFVNSVVTGSTRARQDYYHNRDRTKVTNIILHGDAAISGQGIVYESAQMMSLKGYSVDGTLHIVVNNQVGFTTDPVDARSSRYPTAVGKVTGSPIFHISSESFEDLHRLMRVVAEYQKRFQKDVYINLVSYRRYGHNEGDEPSFTQPLMYKVIKAKKTPYEIYMKKLVSENFDEANLKDLYAKKKHEITAVYEKVKKEKTPIKQFYPQRDFADLKIEGLDAILAPVKTSLKKDTLKTIGEKILKLPDTFHINAKISKIIIHERAEMLKENKAIDWGFAELLAYGTLLDEGYSVRLAGEDAQRGTFSHRHCVLIDAENGKGFNTLKNCENNSSVDAIDSLLSEEAALGYEYGYAITHPKSLVVWEAQYGDFVNGAQVLIDQFISSGESKWCQSQGLVLLLPHGFEGSGPEHSSARLERFLQLCADGNMQVCSFTKSSQFFHALRRQVVRDFRKPLIVMTPKSFLRDASVASKLDEFSHGAFEEILDDNHVKDPLKVERVLLCSGKIGLDLIHHREKESKDNRSAIVRLEQIYPLHMDKLVKILMRYKNAKTFAWVQEDPENMGAWQHLYFDLRKALKLSKKQSEIIYIGRSSRPSPAVGLEKRHRLEQEDIIKCAFTSKKDCHI